MKNLFTTGIIAALSLATVLPAFAETDGSVSGTSSSSISSSSSVKSTASSSVRSSVMKRPERANGMGRMKVKEKMNRGKATEVKPNRNATVDAACAQTAVAKRENAMIAAVDAYSSSVKTSLTTRRDALSAAWSQTDAGAREAAIKAAHEAFKGTWKTANKTLRTAQKAAWQTFRTDAKTCKISVPQSESSAESSDIQI